MLEIKNVKKAYGKETDVLCDVSFSIEDKGIYAVLGDKGEGKTALARIICGCEDADGGEVLLDGEHMSRKNMSLKHKVRLVPTQLALYGTVTPVEHLEFVGGVLGIDPDKKYRQIKEALELVGLDTSQNKPFAALDAFERFALALAASLLGNPDVLVIDDALGGIDAARMDTVRQLIEMLGKIKVIILLTHRPSDVKKMGEHVFLLHNGRIALGGKISDIMAKVNSTSQLYITVRGGSTEVIAAVCSVDTVVEAKITGAQSGGVISVYVEHTPDANIKDKLTSALGGINAPIHTWRAVTLDLEDIFNSFRSRSRKADDGKEKRV